MFAELLIFWFIFVLNKNNSPCISNHSNNLNITKKNSFCYNISERNDFLQETRKLIFFSLKFPLKQKKVAVIWFVSRENNLLEIQLFYELAVDTCVWIHVCLGICFFIMFLYT